jgi:hypothetical protein
MDHHGGYLLRPGFITLVPVADLLVLAEVAEKIAGADKNRARPVAADQGGFFAEMRIEACDTRKPSSPAKALLVFQPIHPALSWAEAAGIQDLKGLFHSFPELTALMEL